MAIVVSSRTATPALLAKLKDDAGLRERLQGTADLDAALALVKEAGFDVSKAEWLRYQASQTSEVSDAELESVAGGNGMAMATGPRHACVGPGG